MKTTIFFLIFLIPFSLFAQKQDSLNAVFPKNSIFNTTLGLRINYDRIFYQKDRFKISAEVGFSYGPSIQKMDTMTNGQGKLVTYHLNSSRSNWRKPQFSVPFRINFLYGKTIHFAEIGFALEPMWVYRNVFDETKYILIGQKGKVAFQQSIFVGYRRQSRKGLFFRIGMLFFRDLDHYEAYNPRVVPPPVNQIRGTTWLYAPTFNLGKSFGKIKK